MSNKKKILFFGLGSIGKKHLEILKKNYDVKIYAYRSRKVNAIPGVKNIYKLDEVLKINADIAFITNPTHLHIKTALTCLKAGINNIFIEKPLSHNLTDLDLFMKEADKKGALIYIGYVMRFNHVLKRLKGLIEEFEERIFYALTSCRSYLPNWRWGMDYRDFYSSKKNQGGGVIFDLIHEFDYNQWLFGKINSINGSYGKISELEIDSEDFCDIFLKFEHNMHGFIHLDYFSYNNQRSINAFSPNEEIFADILNNEILIINDKDRKKEYFKKDTAYMYEEQIKYFMNAVETESTKISNIKDAKGLIEILFNFKKRNDMILNSKIS